MQMKNDMAKRAERAKVQESKYREMPDIVVKVHCKYRAELFFKISRKTKLSRLFNAWTERMETNVASSAAAASGVNAVGAGPVAAAGKKGASSLVNGTAAAASAPAGPNAMQFVFSHGGRTLEPVRKDELSVVFTDG